MTQMLKSEITTTDPHKSAGEAQSTAPSVVTRSITVTGMFTDIAEANARGIVR